MIILCCFAEVCFIAANHSLAGMVAYANKQGSPQVGVSMFGVSITPHVHPDNCPLCSLVMLFGWTQLCSCCFPLCTPRRVCSIHTNGTM